MVCAAKGYRCIITMPDNATKERINLLKAYGAEVYLTPAALRMQGAIDEAYRLAENIPNSFIPMQFENEANPDAHRASTALEIIEAFPDGIDAFVLTAGTGGTVTGTGEELKKNFLVYVFMWSNHMGLPSFRVGNRGRIKFLVLGQVLFPAF